MEVLRSKCRTRVIFAKSDRDIITRRISEIDAIQLVDGEIQFLSADNQIITSANWEAIKLPETSTALEKVTHLTEWLTCEDECDDKCKDCCEAEFWYLNRPIGATLSAPAFSAGAYSEYTKIVEFNFDFPDDLDCKSVYELHCVVSFQDGSNMASDANIELGFFLDEAEIPEARGAVELNEPSQVHSIASSFMIEGDKSGMQLTVGVTDLDGVGRKLDDLRGNLIIKKVV